MMKSEYFFLIETCEKVSGVWENLAKEFQPFDNITLAKVFSDNQWLIRIFFKRPSQGLPCLRKSVTVIFSQTWLDQKLQLPSSQLSHSTLILSLPIPSPTSIVIKLILKMDVVENELTDSGLSEYPSIGWTSPNTSQLQFYYGKNWWMWIDEPTWHVIIVKAEKN